MMLLATLMFGAVLVLGHDVFKCGKYTKEKQCEKKGCVFDEGKCTAGYPGLVDPVDESSDDGWPWNGTQSPDYWENCVRVWCEKHSWYGGMRMCHWKPEYGCGCEAMKQDECLASDECEFVGDEDTGCREKVRCKELNGGQCKNNLDKCALCDSGCRDKCLVGPGQKNLPMLSLELTDNCECKLAAFF